MLVLAGAVFAGLAQVFVCKLAARKRPPPSFSVNAALLSLVYAAVRLGLAVPVTLALLVVTGLLGGLGQVLLTSSYRHANVSVIAPFDYASMLLAIVIGYVVFDEAPTLVVLAGATLLLPAS